MATKKATEVKTEEKAEVKKPVEKKPVEKKAAAKAAPKKAETVKAAAAEKPAEKTAAKKPAARKTAAKKAAEVIIQSALGGEITPEAVLEKVGPVDKVYVRVDQNKAYWVRGEENGSVDLW